MRNGIKQRERPGGIARQRYLLKNAMQLSEKAKVKAKQKQQ